MLQTYAKIFALLTPPERRRFYALLLLVLGVGVLEVIGVASILPFLAVIADPTVIESNARLAAVRAWTGIDDTRNFLIFLGAAVFVIVVAGLAFKTLAFHALFRFTSMRIYSLSTRLMRGYLAQPYVWFLNRHSAELGKNMLSEVDRVVDHVLIPAMRVLAQGAVVTFLVALLVVAEPLVAVTGAVALGGAYGAIFTLARRRIARRGAEQVAANAGRHKAVNEAFGGIKDVKVLGLEQTYLDRFSGPAGRVSRAEYEILTLAELPRYALEAVAFGGMLLFVLAMLSVGDGGGLREILPLLGLYAFAGVRLFPASQQLYANVAKLRFGRAALDVVHADLMEIAAAEAEAEAGGGLPPPMGLRERLSLKGVRYAYPGAPRDALEGIDMEIAARATVGLVGGSGAGKTTAVDVILGLLPPREGVIAVDGVTIDAANRRAWRRSIGYVPQQIFLIDDTIAANIAFGAPAEAIDHAAVERAARAAELHDFVAGELPQGYATLVGERGVRLSGGQRQRIGIARALYHDPDVLIMDEATSALDSLTERAVMDAVRNLGRRKTIILIAHRLSTVRDCDVIFLFDRGRVAAQGSYDALLADNALFRAMAAHPADDGPGAASPG